MKLAFFKSDRRSVLLTCGVMIALIAGLDILVIDEIPLEFLYLFPMLMVGNVLKPWQISIVAALCTLMAEVFDDFSWHWRTGLSRDVLYFAAFLGAGIFVRELNRNRKLVMDQRDARRDAEEQLRSLIETSPAAIVTTDADGNILMANEAAHRLLCTSQGELAGTLIHRFLPSLANVLGPDAAQESFRTVMQARGQRADGETFMADIYFSNYRSSAGSRLTAMVLDASEGLRAHEVSGLQQLHAGSRIAISAISHEIRNVCAAIAAIHQNLANSGSFSKNRDFDALGNLAAALEQIAGINLRQSVDQVTEVDLTAVLDDLRIVISPSMHEADIMGRWNVEPDLPRVWADRASLMQVFLNLTTNSIRALSKADSPSLSITAQSHGGQVAVEITDNGGGVPHPENLFRLFQPGAEAMGLGLYLSRAFLRSFGAEVRYTAIPDGACFIVSLTSVISPR
jgi:PAS domain S-box-containing protein